jgi:hypothetical protein
MREVKVKLFKINELTGTAKAIEWGRQWNAEMFDSDNMTEQLQEHAEYHHGLKTDKCYWSLGHCQGDGVAFYGDIDLTKLAEKQPSVKAILDKLTAMDNTASVKSESRNHRYNHWNSMTVEVEVDNNHRNSDDYDNGDEEVRAKMDDAADALAEELRSTVDELLKTISRSTEKFGYECMDAENEDENIIETLEANEIEFDSTGKVFSHKRAE